MEINGMAHVILTASNFERARDFYRKLLPFLVPTFRSPRSIAATIIRGLRKVMGTSKSMILVPLSI
jgi:catechol 2,3-dioxygenase-like lactoylglutathione lyase family enzyme